MLFAIIFIAFIVWMYWASFFKDGYDKKKQKKEYAAVIAKNNEALERAKLIKRNKILSLEKAILLQYETSTKRFPFPMDSPFFISPINFDENIKAYLNLINDGKTTNNNDILKKIIADYHSRLLHKEKRKKETKQQEIRNEELKKEAEKIKITEEEKRLINERYKNMTIEELNSEAEAWYELQADIARGK